MLKKKKNRMEPENIFDVRNTREQKITPKFQSVIESHKELYGDGLIGGAALINLDVEDPEEAPLGLVVLYDRDAKVHSTGIPNTIGHYLMVSKLLPRKGGYNDAFFQTDEMRQRLNSNVPQFNENPPSYALRNKRTNKDVDVWGPELGPEDGMVGVFKIMEPNGRDAQYYMAVKSSIPEVAQEFKQDIARSDEKLTFSDLVDDRRLHFIDYLGRRNAYRLMFAAARSLGVAIPFGPDHDHYVPPTHAVGDDNNVAVPMRAEPEHIHAISSIEPLSQGGHERIAVYNGVAPSTQCEDECFTYVSPYDGIVRFNMNGNGRGLALPVVTGKKTPSTDTSEVASEIKKRAEQSSIVWEQQEKYPEHVALHPEAHHLVDRDFLRSMQQSGWSREDERDIMIPVLIKISNPTLKRK